MKKPIAVLMLSACGLAFADTCGDTSTTAITSQDGDFAVRIESGSAEESGKKRAECVATLTKWDSKEQSYRFLRRLTLRNPIRPRTAVITHDAQFLVTFDNYCEMGRTPNAVVIYNLQKGTSHAHALEDFLPASSARLSKTPFPILFGAEIPVWRSGFILTQFMFRRQATTTALKHTS